MQIAQIILLITLLVVSFLILVAGYLYIRTQTIKERIQHSIKVIESMNVESFSDKLTKSRSRDQSGEITDYLYEVQETFNQHRDHKINMNFSDLNSSLKIMNWFWVNPFRDAKRMLYEPQQFNSFDDYNPRRWWNIKKPFFYMIKHVEYLEKQTIQTKLRFIGIQVSLTRTTQDKELDKEYSKIIKKEYLYYKKNIEKSNFGKLKNSIKIKKIIEEIDTDLDGIESYLISKGRIAIQNRFKSLKNKIITFAEIITVTIKAYQLLEVDSNKRFNKMREIAKENQKYLPSLITLFDKLTKEKVSISQQLDSALKNLNISKIKSLTDKLEKNLKETERIIIMNIKSGKLVENSHETLMKIAKQIEIQDAKIAHELSKYQDKTYEDIHRELVSDSQQIKIAAHTYESIKSDNFKTFKPWDILTKQSEIKEAYLKHTKEVKDKLLRIKDDLDSIEVIREEIVDFNNSMLNVDSLVNELPEVITAKHNNDIIAGKKLANKIITKAKGGEITDSISIGAKKLRESGESLFTDIATEGLLSVYVKQVILILNIYNTSGKYTEKLKRFKKIYHEEGEFNRILKEAEPLLRKIKNG